jgi:hypothetical protein
MIQACSMIASVSSGDVTNQMLSDRFGSHCYVESLVQVHRRCSYYNMTAESGRSLASLWLIWETPPALRLTIERTSKYCIPRKESNSGIARKSRRTKQNQDLQLAKASAYDAFFSLHTRLDPRRIPIAIFRCQQQDRSKDHNLRLDQILFLQLDSQHCLILAGSGWRSSFRMNSGFQRLTYQGLNPNCCR